MNINEKKTINGIKYFVKNTRNVGRTKLFKLLYFWDFRFFKKYGMSVTCYEYYTFPFGPVPLKLYDQIINDQLPESFMKEIAIDQIEYDEDYDDSYKKFLVNNRNNKIDISWFSPNEYSELKEVAEIFKYATAKEMTEISHLHNSPWDKTIQEHGYNYPIDYFLAIDDESTLSNKEIEEYYTLQKEMCINGRL